MTNIKVLIKKISEVEKYFQIVKRYRKYSLKEIESNLDILGATERYLYLLCQTTIDLAEAVLAYYFFRTPANYGEIFTILKENNVIDASLEKKMIKMTGFRNILAHAYGEVDFDEIYQILKKDIDDFSLFIQEVKEKIHL